MQGTYHIVFETCTTCGLCAETCPTKAVVKSESGMTFCVERLHLCIKCGQCMAICPTASINIPGLSYDSDFAPLTESVKYEALYNLIASRRAARNYDSRPVPGELIDKIIQAVTFAPPSFPPIKTEIVVVQDREIIQKALPLMIDMYSFLVSAMEKPLLRFFIKQRAGKEKYRSMVNHVIPIMKAKLPAARKWLEDPIIHGAPAMMLFHADKQSDNFRTDIYISLAYGLLAAHALGLGASAIDLIPPVIERNKELREMFSIPPGNEVVSAMILGYPKYRYQRIIKRKLKSVNWI